MKITASTTAMLLALTLVVAVGCNVRPAPPRDENDKPVKSLTVTTAGETEAVQRLVDAQAEYRYRLAVLATYYRKAGALAKHDWAQRETTNLAKAHTFEFLGVTPTEVSRGPSIAKAAEATLVERVVEARKAYHVAVDELILYYTSSGQDFKASMADSIRRRYDPVRAYMYFLDAEVPPADLKPAEIIPAAERLYEEALSLHRKGEFLGLVAYQTQREALYKFLQLVRSYPTSTRIAHSAFYIGEIYGRFFDENYRALLWYQRAVQWDRFLDRPARYEAAKIAEFELHEHKLALQLYRDVLKHETFDAKRVKRAQERIVALEQLLDITPPPAP